MGEVENITPGLTREPIVELSADGYETVGKPGMIGDGIRSDVTVEHISSGVVACRRACETSPTTSVGCCPSDNGPSSLGDGSFPKWPWANPSGRGADDNRQLTGNVQAHPRYIRRMELLADPQTWLSFATLLLLELILGVDNVVFISILTGRLPEEQRPRARFIGLSLALVMRLALLFTLSWLIAATVPLFTLVGMEFSARDLILILGGLFLLVKATHEIHQRLEGPDGDEGTGKAKHAVFSSVIIQIALLDIVFSLDSVITAVGMVDELVVMVAAVVVAIGITLWFAGRISDFIDRHPSLKMLALSFLVLIGASLVADGFDQHIPKPYVYGPIAFSLLVEFLNIRARRVSQKRTKPVELHQQYRETPADDL
ncbi:TerC family protein [Stackebrandtia soli]|uniref:TerC family protein n=1 Tax=Stackebrandtia soli TaxID=1892856 RepID=UPI0039E8E828